MQDVIAALPDATRNTTNSGSDDVGGGCSTGDVAGSAGGGCSVSETGGVMAGTADGTAGGTGGESGSVMGSNGSASGNGSVSGSSGDVARIVRGNGSARGSTGDVAGSTSGSGYGSSKGSVSSMSTDMKDIITTGKSGGIVGPSVDINNTYAIPTVNSVPYCGKSPARRYSVRRPNDPYNPSRPAFYNDWSTPTLMDVDQCDPNAMAL